MSLNNSGRVPDKGKLRDMTFRSLAPREEHQPAETVEATPLEESDESSDLPAGSRSIRITIYGVKPDREILRFWIEPSSTYGEIHNELVAVYQNFAIVVLEARYGPKPYWKECVPNRPIESTCRDIYAVAVRELNGPQRFTLGVVRTGERDYPIAIFDTLSESAGTVLQAVATSQPSLVNKIRRISYYSGLHDIRQHNYDYENLRNALLHTFPTAFYITVNDHELPLMTSRPSESIPPFLQAPLVHCQSLLQRGYNLEISPLQTIHVLRAALHLIVSLSIAVAPVLERAYQSYDSQTTDDENQADILRTAPLLAEEIHRIIIAIEGHVITLEGGATEGDQTIWDTDRIFVSLCGDFPGAVTIRCSQGTLEDLKARDEKGLLLYNNPTFPHSQSLDLDNGIELCVAGPSTSLGTATRQAKRDGKRKRCFSWGVLKRRSLGVLFSRKKKPKKDSPQTPPTPGIPEVIPEHPKVTKSWKRPRYSIRQ